MAAAAVAIAAGGMVEVAAAVMLVALGMVMTAGQEVQRGAVDHHPRSPK